MHACILMGMARAWHACTQACPDQCKWNGVCVKRRAAVWDVECQLLKFGCYDPAERADNVFHMVRRPPSLSLTLAPTLTLALILALCE